MSSEKRSRVSVQVGVEEIVTETPYNGLFVVEARALGGRYMAEGKWRFSLRRADAVRALLRRCFGTDGCAPADLVDVRVTVGGPFGLSASGPFIQAFGLTIARRPARDSSVSLYDGVSLMEGPPFPASGGSVKNPRIGADESSPPRVLLVERVPRALAEEAIAELPGAFALAEDRSAELSRQRAALATASARPGLRELYALRESLDAQILAAQEGLQGVDGDGI